MSMLNSEAKLFGLDLRHFPGQLRSAWEGLGQLPWLSRCMPASRLRVLDSNDLQSSKWAWVRGRQRWSWSSDPQSLDAASAIPEVKPAYTALFLGADQQLLRTLHLPPMPQAAIDSAVALDVSAMSPFSEQETLWSYRLYTPAEQSHMGQAAGGGVSAGVSITSRTLVQQALQQSAQTAETVEVWGGPSQLPVMFSGFGEGRRLKGEARQRRTLWLASSVMLALLMALALTPTAQLRLRAIDARVQFQQLLEETAPIAAKRQAMMAGVQEMAQLQEQFSQQVDHLQVLAALTRAYPDDTAVQRIQFKGQQITIQGLSTNAANVVEIMSKTPGFQAVRMPSAVTKVPGVDKENFVVEAQIDTGTLGLYPSARSAPSEASDVSAQERGQ